MSNFRYWEIKGDPEGRHFCFSTAPRFECPFAYFERERVDGEVVRRLPGKVSGQVAAIANVIGSTDDDVMRMLERAHRSAGHHRRRVDGKLTDRCDACGAKMVDHGYSAYVERPKREDEYGETDRASAALSARLGGVGPTVRLKNISGLKRSEARQWAYDEYQIARGALEEAKS